MPRLLFYVMAVLHIYMLLQNKSVGGILFALVPAVYLFSIEPAMGEKARLPLGFIYVIVSVGFLFLALTIMPALEPLFNRLGKDATLTGRVPLWQQVISVISSTHTFFGWGYLRFWNVEEGYSLVHAGFDEDSFFGQMTAGSHNMILEMTLNIGLIGLCIFFLMFILSLRSVPYMREDQYVLCSGYIMMFMLKGLTERGMSASDCMTLMIFSTLGMACSVEIPKAQRMIRRHKPDG